MIADIEDQVAAYSAWLEHRTGVPLSAPSAEAHEVRDDGANEGRRRRPRPRALGVARSFALVVAVAGVVAIASVVGGGQRTDDASSAGESGTEASATSTGVPARFERYVLDDAGNSGRGELAFEDQLLCRGVAPDRTCNALVGWFTVTYTDGVTITTEYGPWASNEWQTLRATGTTATIADRTARVGTDGAIGFEVSAEQRVLITGADESVVAGLEPRAVEQLLPVVFGEAIEGDDDPDSGVAAHYFAAYLDMSGVETCVGGVGIPWNNEASCVVVTPGALDVVFATPSPVGTILVATAPDRTSRLVASSPGGSSADLVVDGAIDDRYVLGFGALGDLVPTQLTALDAGGQELGRVDVVSTGGASLGYVPGTGPPPQLLLPPDDVVPSYAQHDEAMPHRTSGLVQAPSGATFSVNVMENAWGLLPDELDQRQVGTSTWATAEEGSTRSYVSVTECAMVSSNAGPGRSAWSDDALALLASFDIGSSITFDLPDGWSTLAIGPTGERFAMSFDPGDGLADITLTQMPGSNAGPLLSSRPGQPIENVVFRDTPAWRVALGDAGWTMLVWADSRGAFSIQSKDRSLADLAALVDGLSTVSTDQWELRYAAIDAAAGISRSRPGCDVPPLTER